MLDLEETECRLVETHPQSRKMLSYIDDLLHHSSSDGDDDLRSDLETASKLN
jgi:hypothetical protein